MKKFSVIIILLVVTIVAVGCNNIPFSGIPEADLVEKYQLTFEAHIWNDYMPPVLEERPSISYITIMTGRPWIDTAMDVSVTIVTATKTFTRTYVNSEYGSEYRSTENFRLDDNEDYTMYITICVFGEKQTIELSGTVFVTH